MVARGASRGRHGRASGACVWAWLHSPATTPICCGQQPPAWRGDGTCGRHRFAVLAPKDALLGRGRRADAPATSAAAHANYARNRAVLACSAPYTFRSCTLAAPLLDARSPRSMPTAPTKRNCLETPTGTCSPHTKNKILEWFVFRPKSDLRNWTDEVKNKGVAHELPPATQEATS